VKRIVFLLLTLLAAAAAAQAPDRPLPGAPPAAAQRSDLWQMLTPEQRTQLWRSLSPEQQADVWRRLDPDERSRMREGFAPGADGGPAAGGPRGGWMPRRPFDGDEPPHMMMSPEQRARMREQIREAHRLRRERMEAERERRPDRN
jgi:hypothetical protein